MKNICTCKVVVFSLGFFSLIVIKCFVFIHKFNLFSFFSLNLLEILVFFYHIPYFDTGLNTELIVLNKI